MRYFWDLVAIDGEAIALVLPCGRNVSYSDLAAYTQNWRDRINAMDKGERPLIALEFHTNLEAISAYLGALCEGYPIVLVEPGQAGPDTSLHRVYAPDLVIRLDEQNNELALFGSQEVDRSNPEPHSDLAVLLSTSGSTGDPKLVRLSKENIASNANSIAEYLELSVSDCAMLTLPLYYSYGLSVLNSHLAVGSTLILNQNSVLDPEFWDFFRAHEATSLALVPHQFDLLENAGFLENAASRAPSLRYITQAGGRLDPQTADRFSTVGKAQGWNLVLMYGQTEASPRISWVPPEELPKAADTIGKAIPGGVLWLVDEAGNKISEPNVAGELIYKGPNVMMGYGQCREDLSRGDETDELQTGDIAEMTPEGMFRVVGRLKRFVKLFGLRLSLDQIEALLTKHGHPCEAVSVNDRLVLLFREEGDDETVRNIVAQEYSLPPAEIYTVYLEDLPLLPSGKTDRKALQVIAVEASLAQEKQPKNAIAMSLEEILAQATRRTEISKDDSFTSLGGDSLSYLQVQLALEERYGEVPQGWENMSLRELQSLSSNTKISSGKPRIEIDVLLRLFAIILVVAQHSSDYPLYGGTWILVSLVGYSAARFQFQSIIDGKGFQLGWNMIYPLILIYYCILGTYSLFREAAPIEFFLLMGDYYIWQDAKSLLTVYWFVSLYAKIVLLLVIVAFVPPLRRAIRRDSVSAAMVGSLLLLVGSTYLLIDGSYFDGREISWPIQHVGSHGIALCFPFFFAGWMVHKRTKQWHTVAIFCITLWTSFLLHHVEVKTYTLVLINGAFALLVFGRNPPVPQMLRRFLQSMAGLTMFVFLLHNVVAHVTFYSAYKLPEALSVLVAVPVSFAFAFVAYAVFARLERRLVRAH